MERLAKNYVSRSCVFFTRLYPVSVPINVELPLRAFVLKSYLLGVQSCTEFAINLENILNVRSCACSTTRPLRRMIVGKWRKRRFQQSCSSSFSIIIVISVRDVL